MQLTDKIGNTHVEAMENILSFITSFDVYKLLYAIAEKHLDEDDITSIMMDIREQSLKLERQKKFLFNYTKSCNKEYALPNNKLVDTSGRLMRRMRSGVKGIKDAARAFCKTSRKRWPEGKENPQAIHRTLIASETYMKDLFGLETYPQCVKELFVEMADFFNNMNECIAEARRSLMEEKDIRKDRRRCLELLTAACEKSRQNQEFIFEAMSNDPELKAALQRTKDLQPSKENPVLNEWVKSESSEDNKGAFASTFYHNCSPQDVDRITLFRTMQEANGDENIGTCMYVFNCDQEHARHINKAISRFDSLLPEKCKRNNIPALHLSIFRKWCSPTIGPETFLNYFNKRYKEAGGQWKTIGKSALSGVSSKYARKDDKMKEVEEEMLAKLEKIISG